jgi:DNA-directed RNA polymerase specialized sigma24 family protein
MTDLRPNGISYKQHLANCKIKRRQVLALYDFGWIQTEIARKFNCSRTYVKIMILQARKERINDNGE